MLSHSRVKILKSNNLKSLLLTILLKMLNEIPAFLCCDRRKRSAQGKQGKKLKYKLIAIRSEFKTVEPQTQTQVFGGISHSKTDTDTNVRHNRFTVLTRKRTKFDTRISKFSHRKIVFFGRCRPSLRTNLLLLLAWSSSRERPRRHGRC